MKKLLLKLLLIALIILLPLQGFLFFAPMWYQNTDYVMWKSAWEKCEQESGALIIGDSRAKAGIMPTVLSDETVSITVGGGTPAEGYYMLERYLSYNEPPEYIILSYAPFDLAEHGWLWYRTIKYGFLSFKDQAEIVNAYPSSKIQRLKDDVKLVLYRIKYPKLYMAELRDFLENPIENIEKNKATCARLGLFSGYHWFAQGDYSDELNVETGYARFAPTEVLDGYLNRILMLCEQEGIDVIYVTMPMNAASYAVLSDEYMATYGEYMSALEAKYACFNVLYDLSGAPNEWFSDASHFNTQGAQAFSEELEETLHDFLEEK
ncbi:MAG: hypothetical protein AB1Z19_07145 [Eubacteriales bacterium]